MNNIYKPCIKYGSRKDQKGRNTLMHLEPYKDFTNMLGKGYLNCNVMEKICIRASFCGVCYPTAMIAEQILFDANLNLNHYENIQKTTFQTENFKTL